MLNECEQFWASRAAQPLDARLTNHVVAPSVNPALQAEKLSNCSLKTSPSELILKNLIRGV